MGHFQRKVSKKYQDETPGKLRQLICQMSLIPLQTAQLVPQNISKPSDLRPPSDPLYRTGSDPSKGFGARFRAWESFCGLWTFKRPQPPGSSSETSSSCEDGGTREHCLGDLRESAHGARLPKRGEAHGEEILQLGGSFGGMRVVVCGGHEP